MDMDLVYIVVKHLWHVQESPYNVISMQQLGGFHKSFSIIVTLGTGLEPPKGDLPMYKIVTIPLKKEGMEQD